MKIMTFRQGLNLSFAIIASSFLSGCLFLNFFKVKNANDPALSAIRQGRNNNRYFILHQGTKTFAITSLEVDQEHEQLKIEIDTIPAEHTLYVSKPENRRYKSSKPEKAVLTEIHLYCTNNTPHEVGDTFSLAASSLSKIEIIEKDKAKNTSNHILSIVGVVLGSLAIMGVIIALTKSSCPFISGYTDGEFKLQGEVYGGAIYPSLQRHDYLPLTLQPAADNSLRVKISNELQERQYTDLMELWCIDHDPSFQVVQDKDGNLYSVSNPVSPVSGYSDKQAELSKFVDQDERYFDFSSINNSNESQLTVNFDMPAETGNAKLLLRLKNSYWLDFTYGELIKNFGSRFNKWSEQQKGKSASQLNKWKQEQVIPLKIELQTEKGWKEIASLESIGPVAYRDLVVPVDLSKHSGKNIQLRLSTGFMFWEVDYVAMDFSAPQNFTIRKLKPYSAIDETGNMVVQSLINEDKNYLLQPVPGNATTAYFQNPSMQPGMERTYLLHAAGYYEHVRNFTGAANVKYLKTFKTPGALSALSYSRYQQALVALNQ